MSDLNRAMIIGRLGRDPEVMYAQNGTAVANFSIATTDKWKDKNTGEMKEKTEWHRVVAFGRLGEICGEYLKKGAQIFIEGKLRTRSWEKDGVTRYTTEIEANNMQMLGSNGNSNGSRPQQPSQSQIKPKTQRQRSSSGYSAAEGDGRYGDYVPPENDDIPF